MLDRQAAGQGFLIIKPDDFYDPRHRRIAEVLRELYNANVPIDLVTLLDALRRKDVLEDVGGAEFLVQLAESVPSTANAEYYARIVSDDSCVRNFINTAGDLIHQAFLSPDSVDDFLNKVESNIFLATQRRRQGYPSSLRDVLKDTFEEIERAASGTTQALATQFYELNDLIVGLKKSEMIVLAARPSVGKTTLAMNIGAHCAIRDKVPVVLFSLEMRNSEVAKRLLAAEAGIDMYDMGKGILQEGERGKLLKAAGELAEASFFIDDTPGQTIYDIRAKCRRLKMHSDIQLVVIDYLQLLQQPRRAENRQVEVAEISRAVKALARELEVPVMALSQLNREVEHHERLPRLSDIRESGAIEQDADVVLLLHRDTIEGSNAGGTSEATIVVAKNRNGRTGKLTVQFQGKFVRFVPLTYHYTEA